jgi:deazaflavin-dependent oxidoreductase (nitroreductase family)
MTNIPLSERFSVWMEVEILSRLTPRDQPGPFFKWLFKAPILFFRLGLGNMVGRRFLLLTTTGRKTGKPHVTPLEFVYKPEQDAYRVSPGWGANTDWYKNILHDPHGLVQVGHRRFSAIAEPASDEESAHYMQWVSRRHPGMDKVWNRWTDRPLDGSWEGYLHAAKFFPSVWLKPLQDGENNK